MIRVCLVEDQTLVREGLRALLALNSDIAVVGEANDGEEALEVASMRGRGFEVHVRLPLGGEA